MNVKTQPQQYETWGPGTIMVYPLAENKRPVGFAPWPQEKPAEEQPPVKKKRKRAR